METKPITADLSVSGQISAADVLTLRDQGFRAIICNRPDGEGDDQPAFAEIRDAARAAGLDARYQPIVPGQLGATDAARFAQNVRDLPHPVLAYCRTGNRSATLWSLSQG